MPDNILLRSAMTKDNVLSWSHSKRIVQVELAAREIILDAFSANKYDLNDLIIEPVSYNNEDWYLWIVAAKHNQKNSGRDIYDVWTLNLTSISLNHGHYDIDNINDLNTTITQKKQS